MSVLEYSDIPEKIITSCGIVPPEGVLVYQEHENSKSIMKSKGYKGYSSRCRKKIITEATNGKVAVLQSIIDTIDTPHLAIGGNQGAYTLYLDKIAVKKVAESFPGIIKFVTYSLAQVLQEAKIDDTPTTREWIKQSFSPYIIAASESDQEDQVETYDLPDFIKKIQGHKKTPPQKAPLPQTLPKEILSTKKKAAKVLQPTASLASFFQANILPGETILDMEIGMGGEYVQLTVRQGKGTDRFIVGKRENNRYITTLQRSHKVSLNDKIITELQKNHIVTYAHNITSEENNFLNADLTVLATKAGATIKCQRFLENHRINTPRELTMYTREKMRGLAGCDNSILNNIEAIYDNVGIIRADLRQKLALKI